MKFTFLIISSLLFSFMLSAQSNAGITAIPDTSYSIYSAFEGTKKTHTNIKMVPELKNAGVIEEKNIVYTTIANRRLVTDIFYPKEK